MTPKIATISRVKDDRIYGLFPGFVDLIRQDDVENAIDDLSKLNVNVVREIVERIPNQWQVDARTRDALIKLIYDRANFVVDSILAKIAEQCWPDKLFDNQ